MASHSLAQAAKTPEVELFAPNWPPDPDDTGKSEVPKPDRHLVQG